MTKLVEKLGDPDNGFMVLLFALYSAIYVIVGAIVAAVLLFIKKIKETETVQD